jgi:DNA-binding response OmpR family regulator
MGKVLVVEDDFDTLHPLAELLGLKGHSVFTASDAEQGMRLASQQRPDVIITDIALPGKSGLHFINRVRRDPRLSRLPIIVISGCGPAVMVEAEAAGANFCIEKPISLDLFWQAVTMSLGRASGADHTVHSDLMAEPEDPLATDIDRLVARLRSCSSRNERDYILSELKKCILELHGRNDGN